MKCLDSIETFGGHSMAIGMSIKKDNLEKFKKEFEKSSRRKTYRRNNTKIA
ncbi:MAG: hypothetical protein V8R81_07330 [Clostridia bacterium]